MNYVEIAKKLKDLLGLDKPPIAVKFVKPGEPVPEAFQIPGKKIRFCQAVMEATWGKALAVIPTEMACGPGPGSFGAPVKERVLKGEVHYSLGLFEKPEAAIRCLGSNTKMMPGSVAYVLVAPLERGLIDPDTVILRVLPEQAMWLCHTWAYSEGNHLKMDLQTEASFCSGVTVSSYLKNEIQIGLGCYGSRTSTDLGRNEMLVGIPGSILGKVVEVLERLGKPMLDSKSKRIYLESYPENKDEVLVSKPS
ncbi:MAG: DUF169 domain-containing protein [Candidatus Methanomethyliaceae archaeon]|nr:DUF169 domain-containing protein [Candidatus Methanomethyliaceae archaeon]